MLNVFGTTAIRENRITTVKKQLRCRFSPTNNLTWKNLESNRVFELKDRRLPFWDMSHNTVKVTEVTVKYFTNTRLSCLVTRKTFRLQQTASVHILLTMVINFLACVSHTRGPRLFNIKGAWTTSRTRRPLTINPGGRGVFDLGGLGNFPLLPFWLFPG
jgi:hypothetical protein